MPLSNRRNAELFLLGFAALITTVALLIVEANQEQGLNWDLAQYTIAYLALFGGAHLAVRRFAPYADPLLLPVVALLNGLGLVMIHRIDLASGPVIAGVDRGPDAHLQTLWTLVGVIAFSLVVVFLKDYRLLARYGYVCGLTGLVLLAIRRGCGVDLVDEDVGEAVEKHGLCLLRGEGPAASLVTLGDQSTTGCLSVRAGDFRGWR